MEQIGMFPLFYFPEIGSAWIMGITGTIHILASHTSVGAALLFAFLAHKAYKEDRPELYEYMKKYGMFLLIFSYVVGSITGPGIWYTATAASPRGISALIHNFVWVWATEWVFFVFEVVGVFALVYFINKIDRKTHLKLTYAFALASVGTLFLIIGIISFMMWPGNDAFYQTGSVSDAFFGLTTFPHLFLRIGFMIMMSGVIGLIIATSLSDKELKNELIRKMGITSFIGGFITVICFMWYMTTLPDNAKLLLEMYMPDIMTTKLILVVIFSLYFGIALLKPNFINRPIAVVMLFVVAIFGLWPGEKLRESIRKPYVVGQYVYSNQIMGREVPGKNIKNEVDIIEKNGLLKVNPWIPDRLKIITDKNRLEVGELLTKIACSNCHSLEITGKYRPLFEKMNGWDKDTIKSYMQFSLATGAVPYMPKISLPEEEFDAMATWIESQFNKEK
ncbi:c-type cytochrome [Aliarcobacter lanthieri]|uniref:Cytochrome C n=1 Tax=Aliarcobacter vitoriensis TaxID=2011099 RepID=A0A366MTM5_9BACT|nr:cytochrome c [Aliarcobacter vitoriensis]RBQ29628.1 cytochrome C [Aliarcobacter vitoriensis]